MVQKSALEPWSMFFNIIHLILGSDFSGSPKFKPNDDLALQLEMFPIQIFAKSAVCVTGEIKSSKLFT